LGTAFTSVMGLSSRFILLSCLRILCRLLRGLSIVQGLVSPPTFFSLPEVVDQSGPAFVVIAIGHVDGPLVAERRL